MPNDTEVQQLVIYVGTQAKIDEARQAGTIGPDDFAVVTDAPEFALQSTVQAIQVLIPNDASAENQLADKGYVDSSTLPSSTKYGSYFTLSINSTDYKVTATLKDQDGNTLGTPQVIDLPLESVVVGGSYDSQNKKIVLTLENGTTIDVPVGDLVAGLQTEITEQNKLSADLVNDSTSVNKFVTAQDKTLWNNALQPSALNGYATQTWVGQQGYITGISSSDITSALGYTPYDSSNPAGYTSNVGTVTSVNNVNPVNGNVTLTIPSINSSNNYVPYRSSATAFSNSTLMYNSNAMAFTGKLHIGSTSPSSYSNFGRMTIYDNKANTQVSSIALLNYGGGGGCGVAIDMYNTSANSGIPSGRIGIIDNNSFSAYMQFMCKKSGASNNPLVPICTLTPLPISGSTLCTMGVGGDHKSRSLLDIKRNTSDWTQTIVELRLTGSGTTYHTGGTHPSHQMMAYLTYAIGDMISTSSSGTNPVFVTGITTYGSNAIEITTSGTLGTLSTSSVYIKKAFFKIQDSDGSTKLFVDPEGKMGIKTVTPAYDLDVSGTINASTDVKINGSSVALASSVPTDTSDLTNGAGYITSSSLSGYQTTSNLVTSVSSSSTDSQYPSAKCVYDIIGNIETLLSQV